MQYILQIYSNDAVNSFERLPQEQKDSISGEYFAISQTPGITGGAQLQPPTTQRRILQGRSHARAGQFSGRDRRAATGPEAPSGGGGPGLRGAPGAGPTITRERAGAGRFGARRRPRAVGR